jgi:CheY-like chemotaxis protein
MAWATRTIAKNEGERYRDSGQLRRSGPTARNNLTGQRVLPLTRILIADDRESMRGALKTLVALNPEWTVCGATELRPDLIIMDYKMHHSDGLVAAEGIFRALPNLPIVMFTMYKTDELERAASLKGIRCVVGKEEGVPSLLSAIENELSRLAPQLKAGPSSDQRSRAHPNSLVHLRVRLQHFSDSALVAHIVIVSLGWVLKNPKPSEGVLNRVVLNLDARKVGN